MASFSLCTRCILPQMPARLLETDPKTQVVRLINLSHVTADKTPPPTPSIYISCNILASHYTLGNREIRRGSAIKRPQISWPEERTPQRPTCRRVCVCNVNNVFQRLVLSGGTSVHTQTDSIRSNRIPKKRISLATLAMISYFSPFWFFEEASKEREGKSISISIP